MATHDSDIPSWSIGRGEQVGAGPRAMARRRALQVLFVALIVAALPVNYALNSSPFRFSASLVNILLIAVVAALIWPRKASILVSLATVILTLIASEMFFVLHEQSDHFEGDYASASYAARDDDLGRAPNPGVYRSMKCRGDCATHKIYDVSYTIETGGFRHTRQKQDGVRAATVLFYGDSTTFGEGLNDDETLPYYFAQLKPEVAVFNFAFHGYGAHQVLRALETGRFDAYSGRRVDVIVFPTAPWHAARSSCIPYFSQYTPRYVVVDGEAVHAGRCPANRLARAFYQSATYRYFRQRISSDLFDRDKKFELYLAIIKTARRIAEEKYGARFVIGLLDGPDDVFRGSRYSNDRILRYFEENGIETVDIRLTDGSGAADQTLRIPGDGHPSARAQRLRARLLARFLDPNRGG